ncbi:protein lethal(2)denticleless [Cryptotermes secundus]|uniref:protein lethal(2)denticleless n=1 Tax=Cryptotermes secundus TaxID=105785 RepID=UPI000CD7DF0E|nr:protein lethal(2)denticleless [Cryptotermes secundus]
MDFMNALYKRETGRRTMNSYDFAIRRLKCYDCDEFCGIYPNNYGQSNPESLVFACQFCCKANYQHWLALANEDGMIAIQDTKLKSKRWKSGEIYAEGTQAHHNAIFDLAWMEEELKLVSVSGDHTAVLWDVSITPWRQLRQFRGHTRSVKTVVFRPQDKAVFATGARDGMIMVWDTRSNQGPLWDKPDNFISNSHHALGSGTPSNTGSRSRRNKSMPASRANSITSLVFQDEDRLISCGAGDGLIKVWDLRKNYSAYKREPLPCHTLPYHGRTSQNGFTNLVLDPGKLKLYASCMDNVIYCYNVATYETTPIATFIGHQSSTFYVKSCLSPDGLYLASGSSDEHAYIWNTQGLKTPVTSLVGHRAEVTCVQWCPVGDTKIATCSDDARHRIWRVGCEFEDDNYPEMLRGRALTPKITHRDEENTRGVVETSPCASKTSTGDQERTPDFVCSDVILPDTSCWKCNGKGQTTSPCATCLCVLRRKSPRTKRRLEDSLDDGASCSFGRHSKHTVLSPVREGNQESRVGLETRARRLFSPCKHNLSNKSPTSNWETDTKTASEAILSSPTLNLPNYVLDGTSPHHHCSPNARLKENVDWLTKLRKERTNSGESCNYPSAHVTPKRRLTRSRSHEISKGISLKGNSETLWRFFRVAGKSNGELLNFAAAQGDSSPKVLTIEP